MKLTSETLVRMGACIFALQIVNLAEAPYRRRLILSDASMRVVEMRGEGKHNQEGQQECCRESHDGLSLG